MVSMRFFFIIILLIMENTMGGFYKLADLQEYAAMHPELPSSDDEDWLDPDYTTFHQDLYQGFIARFAQLFGLQKKPVWTPNYFEKLLQSIVKEREKQKLSGRLVAHIQLLQPAKFYIWGDLHGAFHSLVRALEWLYKNDVITQDLKIVDPSHYFVFNGDAIDRSPYTLETLSILFLLLERNEKQVFYIRGKHEVEGHWQNFSLNRELHVRIGDSSEKKKPLIELVRKFFNTLPLALYINTKKNDSQVIRISHYGRDSLGIDEEYFGNFWNETNKEDIMYYDVRNKKKSKKSVSVEAMITTEDLLRESRTINGDPKDITGLGLLDQEYGSMTWAILSAPIMPYQTHYNFYSDAFAVLDVKTPISDSTITLYNQNLKKKDGFKKNKTFKLFFGVPADIDRGIVTELKVGSTIPLRGTEATSGIQDKRGISARIREANQSIGPGRKYHIKLIIYNDDYDPYLARKNIRRLIEKDKVDIILCPLGSPTLAAYLDYVKEGKILILFPITGSDSFRKKDLVNLINWRATYSDEISALVNYIMAEHFISNFAFFYQDDAFGTGALKVAHDTLKKKGISEWTDISYGRGSSKFSEQAKAMKIAQPGAIGLLSTALPSQEFMRQIGVDFLANKIIFGMVGQIPFRQFAEQKGIQIYWGSAVPNPKISDLEIVKEYRQAMNRNNYPLGVFSLEAYIGTSIFIEMLQKIEGDVTFDKIKQQFEVFNNFQFKGFTLNFNPETRTIFDSVWIETGENKKWIKKEIK
ncbi:MAG: ABC transporter substrate-binding protein [Candidatus Babeliales bacterium]